MVSKAPGRPLGFLPRCWAAALLLPILITIVASPALAESMAAPGHPVPSTGLPALIPTPTPPALTLEYTSDLKHGPDGPQHGSTLIIGGLYLAASLSALVIFPPDNWNGNITPRPSQFAHSWSAAPTWHDGDPWTTNYVGHPIMGSVLYVFARRYHHSPLQAFLFSTVASTTWEYAFESWYEQPSWSDLLVTSTAGALIGECRWQIRKLLLRGGVPGAWGQIGLFLVDPLTEIDILFFGAKPI